jgi:glycosyltransferase involved in cell wall biosynthesis
VDVIDIWPELFNVILPHSLRFLGKLIFSPFYYQRFRLLKKADGIVTVAENYRQIVLKYVTSKPVEVVYWGVNVKNNDTYNISSLPKVLVKEQDEYWILYAGTLGSNYDIQSILKAGLLLENNISNFKIIIIGDGNLRSIVEDVIKKNNLKKTIYLGSMSTEELQFFYKYSDIGISSYVEDSTVAMPIKAYDYMIHGLPLVNSLKRDLGDLVVNNQIGIQYKAGDAYSLYNSIIELCENQIKRDDMAERMKKVALQFDYDLQYGKYVTFIETIVFEKITNKLHK